MEQLHCANCRRPLPLTEALENGKLCDKCNWAAHAEFFQDDTPTRPREEIPEEITIIR